MGWYEAWGVLFLTVAIGSMVIGEQVVKWFVEHGFPWWKRS
jgi:hypothetical protein